MLPPWGVPVALHVRIPSSSTPALSHFWIPVQRRRPTIVTGPHHESRNDQ